MIENIVSEVNSYLEEIQNFSRDMAQDATALHEYLIRLTNIMARCNQLMAEWKRVNREETVVAYQNLQVSLLSQKKNFSPSMAKDYVNAKCSESGYLYDLAERCSRLCTHTIDAIRTVISSLKSEREFAQFSQ
jgi:hypothetical protein